MGSLLLLVVVFAVAIDEEDDDDDEDVALRCSNPTPKQTFALLFLFVLALLMQLIALRPSPCLFSLPFSVWISFSLALFPSVIAGNEVCITFPETEDEGGKRRQRFSIQDLNKKIPGNQEMPSSGKATSFLFFFVSPMRGKLEHLPCSETN